MWRILLTTGGREKKRVRGQIWRGPPDAVRKKTNGRGAGYAFLKVGSIEALRAGEFIGREKILTGSMMGSTRLGIDVARYVELYRAGQLKLNELISGHHPLEKTSEAIESAASGKGLHNITMFSIPKLYS